MTFPANPADRQPKGDHNRRLSLGLSPEQFAEAAGVSVEALRDYELTGPDQAFDVAVAAKVAEALQRLEKLIPNSEAAGVNIDLHGRSRDEVLRDDALEERVRDTAYRLWEEGGRIEGRDHEYWYRAVKAEQAGKYGTEPAGSGADAVDRAFEASRKIGLQREFKKAPDETASGGFNQRSKVAETADTKTNAPTVVVPGR
jgi:transcriptional regulator with XRE-family HTH domain